MTEVLFDKSSDIITPSGVVIKNEDIASNSFFAPLMSETCVVYYEGNVLQSFVTLAELKSIYSVDIDDDDEAFAQVIALRNKADELEKASLLSIDDIGQQLKALVSAFNVEEVNQ